MPRPRKAAATAAAKGPMRDPETPWTPGAPGDPGDRGPRGAKGVPTGQAQEISQELQDSGGESIPDLATEPGGVDLVQVATGTFTNASKSVTWVVVFTLSAGLLVSFWIPKNAAREKQAG